MIRFFSGLDIKTLGFTLNHVNGLRSAWTAIKIIGHGHCLWKLMILGKNK